MRSVDKGRETENSSSSLLLLAHHHCTGNIASQRFRGLVKYLPRRNHEVRVISGPSTDESMVVCDTEVTVVEEPLLSKSSFDARIEALWCMLISRRGRPLKIRRNSWISKAVNEGRAFVQNEKRKGRRVVIMATYSPIDTLIAARLIADSENVPLVQDFRDGLAFESLGRSGKVFRILRKVIEAWSISTATGVSTVSRPLVSYFQGAYPKKEVSLLYNGFDRSQFDEFGGNPSEATELPISIGHFGRVSASEAARMKTLCLFLKIFEGCQFNGRLDFFGELTADEKTVLADANIPCNIHGHINRKAALERMNKMGALLIVTGKSRSVATGKIYEYLFSGKRIILATQCQNEASRILTELGDEDIILDFSDSSTIPSLHALEAKLAEPFSRNFDAIKDFDKSVQAQQLSNMLLRHSESKH